MANFPPKKWKKKNKNSPNTTSQDQALPIVSIVDYNIVLRQPPAQIQSSAAPASTKNTEPCLQSISLAHPASYVCMCGTCAQLLSRTADNRSRSNHENQPSHINVFEFAATCDGSLRLVIVRCDSVLIQDCELSQRESISLRLSMVCL